MDRHAKRGSGKCDRRHLLRTGLAFGLGQLVLGCSRTAAAPPRDALAETPAVDDGDPAPPPVCAPTADNIEGPFYKAGAPHRATLVGAGDPGERLVIGGTVRAPDCAPIAGAVLDIWHADHRGGYDLAGFGLRGQLVTDAHGRWQLATIVPGRYLNGRRYRPAHVHVKLRAAGRELTTQLYFADDPYLRGDPWVVDSLVLAHRRDGARRVARFDFVV